MTLDEHRLIPAGADGRGRLARWPGIVLLVENAGLDGDGAGRALFRACADAAAKRNAEPLALTLQSLTGLDGMPAFCALADQATGLSIFVHGPVDVLAEHPDGPLELHGGSRRTWMGGSAGAASTAIRAALRIGDTGNAALGPVAPGIDMRAGIVAATALIVVPMSPSDSMLFSGLLAQTGAPVSEAAPPASLSMPPMHGHAMSLDEKPVHEHKPAMDDHKPAMAEHAAVHAVPVAESAPQSGPQPSINFTSFSLHEPDQVRAPLPVAGRETSAPVSPVPDSGPRPVEVHGVNCKRGHFNDIRAQYCGVCGIQMIQASVILVKGTRPPLGVFVADTGAAIALSADLVIGRDPSNHERVLSGNSNAVVLDDPSQTLSRAHVAVIMRDWDVFIADLGSANHTYLLNEQGSDTRALAAGEEVRLPPGQRFRMGQVRVVFESPLSQT